MRDAEMCGAAAKENATRRSAELHRNFRPRLQLDDASIRERSRFRPHHPRLQVGERPGWFGRPEHDERDQHGGRGSETGKPATTAARRTLPQLVQDEPGLSSRPRTIQGGPRLLILSQRSVTPWIRGAPLIESQPV